MVMFRKCSASIEVGNKESFASCALNNVTLTGEPTPTWDTGFSVLHLDLCIMVSSSLGDTHAPQLLAESFTSEKLDTLSHINLQTGDEIIPGMSPDRPLPPHHPCT